MANGKVYIVQEPLRRGRNGELESFMNLTPASIYGQLEILLDRKNITLNPAPMVDLLKRKLREFSDDDYLLGVGDTGAMMAASMVAGQMNRGRVNVLKWDRETGSYLVIRLEV